MSSITPIKYFAFFTLFSANGKLQSKEEELTKSLEDIENMKACVKSVESELEQVSSKKSSDTDEVGASCHCEAQKRSENMEKIQKQLHEELLTSNKKVCFSILIFFFTENI